MRDARDCYHTLVTTKWGDWGHNGYLKEKSDFRCEILYYMLFLIQDLIDKHVFKKCMFFRLFVTFLMYNEKNAQKYPLWVNYPQFP